MYDSYMPGELRVTTNVAKVLRVFLDDLTGEHYGYTLMHAAALPSGNLYPILSRLEAAGWIEGHREDIDPTTAGRRPRRYYRLTKLGREVAIAEARRLASQVNAARSRRLLKGSPS